MHTQGDGEDAGQNNAAESLWHMHGLPGQRGCGASPKGSEGERQPGVDRACGAQGCRLRGVALLAEPVLVRKKLVYAGCMARGAREAVHVQTLIDCL